MQNISTVHDYEKGEFTPIELQIIEKINSTEDRKRYRQLISNRNKLLTALVGIEEMILSSNLSLDTLQEKWQRANELSNMVQYLNGIEKNRFIAPIQFAEANRKVVPVGGLIKAKA